MAFTTEITEREHYFSELLKSGIQVPKWFKHNAPEKPVEPDVTGLSPELKEAAQATHYRAMEAWRTADHHARTTQYYWLIADAAVKNKAVTTTAASTSGEPSEPPPPEIAPEDYQKKPKK